MSVNPQKIRLGAATQVLVGTVDMGSTKGGQVLTYNFKDMSIRCDQFLAPVTVFKTEEEVMLETTFYEFTMQKLGISIGLLQGNGDVTTTAGSPNTDTLNIGGRVNLGITTLDSTIPKNDGTSNNLILHINKVYSAKSVKFNFARDKDTEYKVEFMALADPTQPAGMQLAYIKEQY